MRFVGSVTWHWEGRVAFKARNKLNVYVCPSPNFMDNLGKDPRYFEFFQDFAGAIWVRRPAGTQVLLEKPYTLVRRELGVLSSKEVLDDSLPSH